MNVYNSVEVDVLVVQILRSGLEQVLIHLRFIIFFALLDLGELGGLGALVVTLDTLVVLVVVRRASIILEQRWVVLKERSSTHDAVYMFGLVTFLGCFSCQLGL